MVPPTDPLPLFVRANLARGRQETRRAVVGRLPRRDKAPPGCDRPEEVEERD